MSFLILKELKSIDFKNCCLFCLDHCTGESLKRSVPDEQLLQQLSSVEQGFSKFFWESLIGKNRVSFSPACKQENEENPEESGVELSTPKSCLSLCSNCLKAVQQVKQLHSELEKIQLTLTDKISMIQGAVKECCSKEKSKRARLGERGSRKLSEFQHKVISKSRESCKIPLIFLEKFNPVVSGDRDAIPVFGLNNRIKRCTATLKKDYCEETRPFEDIETVLPNNKRIKHNIKHEDNEDVDWSPSCSVDDDDDYAPPETKIWQRKKLYPAVESSGSVPKRRRGRPPKSLKAETETTQNLKRSRGRRGFKIKPEPEETNVICHDSIQDKAKRVRKNYILLNRQQHQTRVPVIRKKQCHRNFCCELCGKVYLRRPAYERHKLAHKQSPEEIIKEVQDAKECKICGETVDHSEYYSHLLSHEQADEEKSFVCFNKDCGRRFQIEENLQIHIEVDHDELKPDVIKKCDVCNIGFEGNTDLLEHVKRVHKNYISSLLYCPVCSYCFTIKENLISHMHTHTELDQQICFVCDCKFSGRSELLDHFQQEHNLNTSSTCSICQKEFSDLYLQKVHMRTEHKSKDIHICCYCGKRCYFASSFVKHINTHQKTEHKCSDCGEIFRNENKLAKHRIVRHGAPKVPCEICGNEYITPSALSTHMKEHSKDAYHCEICDKYYGAKTRYDDHMRSLHSDERKFTCELCGFTCKTAGVLGRHRLTHTKPFVCNVCDRRFARRFTLNSHMNMHTGASFVCHICGYEFSNRKSCNTHVKKYHTGDNPMLLYKPQKRRRPRLKWKDSDGNVVIAKNASSYVDPARLLPSGSATTVQDSSGSVSNTPERSGPIISNVSVPEYKTESLDFESF